MKDFSEKLSAYIDGELDSAAAEEVEARLAADPDAQAELDALLGADAVAREVFEEELNAPVPFALAQQIKNTPMVDPAASAPVARRPVWGAIAAGLAVFAIGGAGGFWAGGGTQAPVQTAGWLADIADYHAVYAAQGRHLVEVSASEADHIQTWLGNTVGTEFTIPDLGEFGLTFEGGRLLVAAGKPVAQLMYRDADGMVIALCFLSSGSDAGPTLAFNRQTLNGFDMVSWKANEASYVVVGPEGNPDLDDIAANAAVAI